MIEATYLLTIDDLMDAGKIGYRHDVTAIFNRVGSLVVGLGLIAIAFTQKPSPLYWLILLGAFFVWRGIRSPVHRMKNYYKKIVTNEHVDVQVDEVGVRTVSPNHRTETKWAGFRYALETPKTFSLYTIANKMYVFPKRAFNEESCEELRKLIARNGIPTKPL